MMILKTFYDKNIFEKIDLAANWKKIKFIKIGLINKDEMILLDNQKMMGTEKDLLTN